MDKKVLVIDDDAGILDAFQAMLESEGYKVDTSVDPNVIFAMQKEKLPCLILLDVLLSGTDGRDICRQIRQTNTLKHIPVIMISAAPQMENSVKNAGATDFLKKPFEMDDLLNKVRTHMLS